MSAPEIVFIAAVDVAQFYRRINAATRRIDRLDQRRVNVVGTHARRRPRRPFRGVS